jgi:hypothetical protein
MTQLIDMVKDDSINWHGKRWKVHFGIILWSPFYMFMETVWTKCKMSFFILLN